MNTQQLVNNYIKVADYLGDLNEVALLNCYIDRLENKEYYLPFIGQFSAGKSKLINRIIGRDILPTKRTETTAFLTYIKYGNEENAVIEYSDSTFEQIPISKIKSLDYKSTQNFKSIKSLTIMLPLDILKSGLTIVDTPGVNTLINEHVKMSEELLASSQYVIYVMNGSPTNIDFQMAKKIHDLLIPVIFVRTHIDELNEEEENPIESIKKDQDCFQKLFGENVLYFPLCNEINEVSYKKWQNNYNDFIRCISESIASDIDKVYEYSIVQRLSLMKDSFLNKLNDKESLTRTTASESISDIEKRLQTIDHKKKDFESSIKRKENLIKHNGDLLLPQIEREITNIKNQGISDIKENCQYFSDGDLQKNVREYYGKNLPLLIEKMGDRASQSITKWVKESSDGITEELNDIKIGLDEVNISFSSDFSIDVIKEYSEKEIAIEEDFDLKYSAIQELNKKGEEELLSLGLKKQEIEDALCQYEALINEKQNNYNEIKQSYTPQYRYNESKWGKYLKRVGQVGDIAMLLIPAAGWEKAGAMLAKKAGTLASKTGKLAQLGSKTLTTLSKGANAMAKVDPLLDTTKIVKGGTDAIKQNNYSSYIDNLSNRIKSAEEKKKAGIFDYLSLSYWFEKCGEMIDPSTMVLDEEYETNFKNILSEKENEINSQIHQKVLMLQQQGQIKTAIERISKEAELRNSEYKNLEKYKVDLKNRLEHEKQKKMYVLILDAAVSQYESRLSEYSSILMERVKEEQARLSTTIIDAAKDYAESQLTILEKQYNDIIEQKKSNEFSLNDSVSEINSIKRLMDYEQ